MSFFIARPASIPPGTEDLTAQEVAADTLDRLQLALHHGRLIGLELISDQPQRYRVNIFLEDMDKAFGHLVPRKGSPPVLEAGKSATVKIPFIGTDKESKKILVMVKTVSVD